MNVDAWWLVAQEQASLADSLERCSKSQSESTSAANEQIGDTLKAFARTLNVKYIDREWKVVAGTIGDFRRIGDAANMTLGDTRPKTRPSAEGSIRDRPLMFHPRTRHKSELWRIIGT